MKRVTIIGAGVSGMSAAVELVKNGFAVEVFEAKKYPGGRCFSIIDEFSGDEIDNGQHVFVGAYTHFFNLLKDIDSLHLVYPQEAMNFPIFDEKASYSIKAGKLPGKMGVLQAIINYQALDFRSKLQIVLFLAKMKFLKSLDREGALEFLERNNQSDLAIRYFWEPIILATMNQNVQKSSAELLLVVLRKILDKPESGKIIFSKVGLSRLFDNFKPRIESNPDSKVNFSCRIKRIDFEGNRATFAVNAKGQQVNSDYIVSTIPPSSLSRLLIASEKSDLVNTEFDHSSIISCYIWTNKELHIKEFAGIVGNYVDWIFDKRHINQSENMKYPYLYTVTISNADRLVDECHDKIAELIADDLRTANVLGSAIILHYRLLVDKRATISICTESNIKRPRTHTNIENFFVAGDWTSTGLPATIEGAAQSGVNVAKIIIAKEKSLQ